MQWLMPLKSMLPWVQWGTFALFLLEVEQCRDAEFHCWVQQLRGLLVAKAQRSISASLPLGVQISPVLRHLEPIWE